MGPSAFIDEFLHTYLGGEFYPDHPSPIGTYFLNTLQRTRAGTYRTVLKQVTLEHDLRMEVPTALVGIITDSGGPGAMMTKTAELYGLEVPEFSKTLQKEIGKELPTTASATNPIDATFHGSFLDMLIKFPKILMESGEVDSVIVFGIYDFDEIIEVVEKSGGEIDNQMKQMRNFIEPAIIKPIKKLVEKFSIPIFYSGPVPYRSHLMQKLNSSEIPAFSLWDQPTKCLAMLTRYSEYRQNAF